MKSRVIDVLCGFIYSKEDLFKAIKEACDFPDYFGNNWDALFDCMISMQGSDITLQIKNVWQLSDEDLISFLRVLEAVSANYLSHGRKFKIVI